MLERSLVEPSYTPKLCNSNTRESKSLKSSNHDTTPRLASVPIPCYRYTCSIKLGIPTWELFTCGIALSNERGRERPRATFTIEKGWAQVRTPRKWYIWSLRSFWCIIHVLIIDCSVIVASRKRKLRELYAICDNDGPVPQHSVSNPDVPYTTTGEKQFLEISDISQYV